MSRRGTVLQNNRAVDFSQFPMEKKLVEGKRRGNDTRLIN